MKRTRAQQNDQTRRWLEKSLQIEREQKRNLQQTAKKTKCQRKVVLPQNENIIVNGLSHLSFMVNLLFLCGIMLFVDMSHGIVENGIACALCCCCCFFFSFYFLLMFLRRLLHREYCVRSIRYIELQFTSQNLLRSTPTNTFKLTVFGGIRFFFCLPLLLWVLFFVFSMHFAQNCPSGVYSGNSFISD